jgi:hypothetical protein
MVERGADCQSVLQQIIAVQAALHQMRLCWSNTTYAPAWRNVYKTRTPTSANTV